MAIKNSSFNSRSNNIPARSCWRASQGILWDRGTETTFNARMGIEGRIEGMQIQINNMENMMCEQIEKLDSVMDNMTLSTRQQQKLYKAAKDRINHLLGVQSIRRTQRVISSISGTDWSLYMDVLHIRIWIRDTTMLCLIIFLNGNMLKHKTDLYTYTRAIVVKGYRLIRRKRWYETLSLVLYFPSQRK